MSIGHDLAGRTALVTGGSNGIGRAIVRALLDAGARVAVLDLAGHEPGRDDARGLTIVGDVGLPVVATGTVEHVVDRFGSLDVLVNDAAAYPDALLTEMPVGEGRRGLGATLTGPVFR